MSEKTAVKTDKIKPNWQAPRSHGPSKGKARALQRELEDLESRYGVELTRVEPTNERDGLGQLQGGRANEYP